MRYRYRDIRFGTPEGKRIAKKGIALENKITALRDEIKIKLVAEEHKNYDNDPKLLGEIRNATEYLNKAFECILRFDNEVEKKY